MPELGQHFEQNIEQALHLHLSPQMLAMMRLLQLSYADLVAEVEKVAEENPTLEVERPEALAEYLRYLGSDKKVRKQVDFSEYPGMENVRDNTRNLTDHLLEQLRLVNLDNKSLKIGEYLIGSLDASGYLRDYDQIKAEIMEKLEVEGKAVEQVLKVIQGFEPEGVGARDLKECLLIQLREQNFDNIELEEILEEAIAQHLEDIGQKKYKAAAEAMGIGEEGVIEIADFIRENLNPNPASAFGEAPVHVVPSFVVEEKGKGEYKFINLEERYGPRLKISAEYEKMLKDKKTDAETVKFIKEKMNQAKEFIENLKKRGKISEQVMQIVVETQQEYLEKGAAHLKPLRQKDLAAKLGVHPSTISRAVAEKYVQTPRGLLPVKFLCQRELAGFSQAGIQALLLDLVADEDRRHPYSDDQLKELLGQKGVRIERRTIAGYRKQLGIQSAGERAA